MQVITKVLNFVCYCCKGQGWRVPKQRGKALEHCDACNKTGIYKENYYYHIVEHNGQKICIDGDTLK